MLLRTAETGADLPASYPSQLIDMRWLGHGQRLLLRPVLPQDHSLLSALLLAQSARARRNRFHGAVQPSSRWCRQMSQVDHRRQLALVVCSVTDGAEQLLADARYGVSDDGCSAEFALMVDERWQRHGIGAWALDALQQAARAAGLDWLHGDVLHDNLAMLALARHSGFACSADPEDERLVRIERRLSSGPGGDAAAHRPPASLLRRMARALAGRPALQTRPQR